MTTYFTTKQVLNIQVFHVWSQGLNVDSYGSNNMSKYQQLYPTLVAAYPASLPLGYSGLCEVLYGQEEILWTWVCVKNKSGETDL
jgi:hypothetical protein